MILWGKVLKQLNKEYTIDNGFTNLKQALEYLYHIKGLSTSQLSKICGCSMFTLVQKMKDLSIERRSRGGPNNKLPWMMSKEEYENLSTRELCLRHNTCPDVVRRRRREYESSHK